MVGAIIVAFFEVRSKTKWVRGGKKRKQVQSLLRQSDEFRGEWWNCHHHLFIWRGGTKMNHLRSFHRDQIAARPLTLSLHCNVALTLCECKTTSFISTFDTTEKTKTKPRCGSDYFVDCTPSRHLGTRSSERFATLVYHSSGNHVIAATDGSLECFST